MVRNDTIPPTQKAARSLIRITWHTFRVICSAQTYPPAHGLGPPGSSPIPFYLQVISSISEVQLRIC